MRHLSDPTREVQVTGFEGGACTDKLDPAWGPYLPAFAWTDLEGTPRNISLMRIGLTASELAYVNGATWLVTYAKELGASTPQECGNGCRIFAKALGPDLTAANVETFVQGANGLEVQLTFHRYGDNASTQAAIQDRKPQFELATGLFTTAEPSRYGFSFIRRGDPTSQNRAMVYLGTLMPGIAFTEQVLEQGSNRANDADPGNDPPQEQQLPGSLYNLTVRHSGFCAAIPAYDFDDVRWFPDGMNLVATARVSGYSQIFTMSILEGRFLDSRGQPSNTAAICSPQPHYISATSGGEGSTVFQLTSSAEDHELPQVSPYRLYEIQATGSQSSDPDHWQYGILYQARTSAGAYQIRGLSAFIRDPEAGNGDFAMTVSSATREQTIAVTGTNPQHPSWGNRLSGPFAPMGGGQMPRTWISYDAANASGERQIHGAVISLAGDAAFPRMPPDSPAPQTPGGAPLAATVVSQAQWTDCQNNYSPEFFAPSMPADPVTEVAPSDIVYGKLAQGPAVDDHRIVHLTGYSNSEINEECNTCGGTRPQLRVIGTICDNPAYVEAYGSYEACAEAFRPYGEPPYTGQWYSFPGSSEPGAACDYIGGDSGYIGDGQTDGSLECDPSNEDQLVCGCPISERNACGGCGILLNRTQVVSDNSYLCNNPSYIAAYGSYQGCIDYFLSSLRSYSTYYEDSYPNTFFRDSPSFCTIDSNNDRIPDQPGQTACYAPSNWQVTCEASTEPYVNPCGGSSLALTYPAYSYGDNSVQCQLGTEPGCVPASSANPNGGDDCFDYSTYSGGGMYTCDPSDPTNNRVICRDNNVCGDGNRAGTEQCDDGNVVSGDGCDANCSNTRCGNSVVTAGEQCDDGNPYSGDGCSATCQLEVAVCGNGTVEGAEECDDGDAADPANGDYCDQGCNAVCMVSCNPGSVASGGSSTCTLAPTGMEATCSVTNGTLTANTPWRYTVSNITANSRITCNGYLFRGQASCFYDISVTSAAVCNNGLVEAGEQCDDGNNLPGDCCSPTCQFESAGTVCRASNGVCDPQEVCTGSSGFCPGNAFAPSTTVCRASNGACDVQETCTGTSSFCPIDGFASGSTVCRASAGACDVAESCTGTSAACPTDSFASSATVCRASAGACDVAESCSGSAAACPNDNFAPSSTVCRTSAGACDLAETCTGSTAACPADATAPAGTVCRASAGACDIAETCSGGSIACPVDGFAPSTTVCRASGSACDPEESCSGSGASCPADVGATDQDGDTVDDCLDNCPSVANPGQQDTDADGTGDACEAIACGNSLMQPGEQCDDGNTAAGDGCGATCQIERCGDGIVNNNGTEQCDDGNADNTDGCLNSCQSARCGDAFVRAGVEQCDDGNGVETDDCLNACLSARCGDGSVRTGFEACDDGNADNTDGCTGACALPSCGDGFVQAGEACDDGNASNTDACLNSCMPSACGDGFLRSGVEACDDGNLSDTDSCLGSCVPAACGDGFVRTGVEQCDDGNDSNTDSCLNSCVPASCGDGFVQPGEACDDGNTSNTDACLNTCAPASCGDGFVQPGEACDDGNTSNTDACLNTCAAAACGDGFVRAGSEACDDGNGLNSDACLNTCVTAACGDGFVRAGVEQCDDGNAVNTDFCTASCQSARCGDGFVQVGETCDDGNAVDTDFCTSTCDPATCGDGTVQAVSGEECEDGNSSDSDACAGCRDARCGDGFVQAGVEQCDDGNASNTDFCDNSCEVTFCGDGIRNRDEQCDDGNASNEDFCSVGCLTCETGTCLPNLTVTQTPDLFQVTLPSDTDQDGELENILFTVRVANTGAIAATNVVVRNAITEGLTYQSQANRPDDRCAFSANGTFSCTVDRLNVGEVFEVSFYMRPQTPGQVLLLAQASAAEPESNADDNQASSNLIADQVTEEAIDPQDAAEESGDGAWMGWRFKGSSGFLGATGPFELILGLALAVAASASRRRGK